jgi:hypothetical protein
VQFLLCSLQCAFWQPESQYLKPSSVTKHHIEYNGQTCLVFEHLLPVVVTKNQLSARKRNRYDVHLLNAAEGLPHHEQRYKATEESVILGCMQCVTCSSSFVPSREIPSNHAAKSSSSLPGEMTGFSTSTSFRDMILENSSMALGKSLTTDCCASLRFVFGGGTPIKVLNSSAISSRLSAP